MTVSMKGVVNMDLIDMHADIGYDLFVNTENDDEAIERMYNIHIPKLNKGGYQGVAVVNFFDGQQTFNDTQAMVSKTKRILDACSDKIHPVLTPLDFNRDGLLAICAVEGLGGVDLDAEAAVPWLAAQGIRLASLQWNLENCLSTGVLGDVSRGLTKEGQKVIQLMNHLGMVIDVSHANEKSFYETLEASSRPIIATHSNAYALCPHPRNLKDEQIKAIGSCAGLIGLNAVWQFTDLNRATANSDRLAEHASYIAERAGVDCVALGFDLMDFLGDEKKAAMIPDLSSFAEGQQIVCSLRKKGFLDEDIEKVTSRNVIRFFKAEI